MAAENGATLAAAVFADHPSVQTIDIWSAAKRAAFERTRQWSVDAPSTPYVMGLDTKGVLEEGGLLIVFELEEGEEIDFTVELSGDRPVLRKSICTEVRDSAFRALEEALETLVREWLART